MDIKIKIKKLVGELKKEIDYKITYSSSNYGISWKMLIVLPDIKKELYFPIADGGFFGEKIGLYSVSVKEAKERILKEIECMKYNHENNPDIPMGWAVRKGYVYEMEK